MLRPLIFFLSLQLYDVLLIAHQHNVYDRVMITDRMYYAPGSDSIYMIHLQVLVALYKVG